MSAAVDPALARDSSAAYLAGSWRGLVSDGALALLHPEVSPEVASELWLLVTEGKRLGAWVEYLAGAGIRTLPSFAMVESHERGLRVLVRGAVEVVVGTHRIDGRDYATWREEVVAEAGQVQLRAATGSGHWWPIGAGIVPAAELRATLDRAGSEAGVDEEDVELTVARMPALAAALRPDAPRTPEKEQVPAPGAAGDPASTEASTEAGAEAAAETHTEVAAADDAEADAEISDDYDHLLWSTEQQAATQHAAGPQAAGRQDAGGSAPAAVPDPGAGNRQQSAEPGLDLEATREPEPDGDAAGGAGGADPARPSDPARPAGSAEHSDGLEEADSPWQPPGQHAGSQAVQAAAAAAREAAAEPGRIIDSVPPWLRPAPSGSQAPQPPPETAAAAPPQPPAPVGPPLDQPSLPTEHTTGHGEGDAEHTVLRGNVQSESTAGGAAEAPSSSQAEPAPPAPALLGLTVSTGQRVSIDRAVLVGRAPEAARFGGDLAPRLVRVPNPQKDISATHVEVRPAGDHVVVTDMNSTNGTVVHLPDQPSFRLQPGTGVPVAPGATIDLGGVTMVVEREGSP